jgi:ubiquinone/menaquinone biosynthesis C-methylase UbiE
MSKTLVQQQFGANAAAYATSTVHAKGASLARLVELVKPKADWTVLDIATGAGHTALAFAPHVAHVVASDLTPEMLIEAAKLAADKGYANMTTAKADAERLPFADASFDVVVSNGVIDLIPDKDAVFAELHRVLAPGGRTQIADVTIQNPVSEEGRRKIDLWTG